MAVVCVMSQNTKVKVAKCLFLLHKTQRVLSFTSAKTFPMFFTVFRGKTSMYISKFTTTPSGPRMWEVGCVFPQKFFLVFECFVYIYGSVLLACLVPSEAKKGHQISWKKSYRVTLSVRRIELRSSGRAINH